MTVVEIFLILIFLEENIEFLSDLKLHDPFHEENFSGT